MKNRLNLSDNYLAWNFKVVYILSALKNVWVLQSRRYNNKDTMLENFLVEIKKNIKCKFYTNDELLNKIANIINKIYPILMIKQPYFMINNILNSKNLLILFLLFCYHGILFIILNVIRVSHKSCTVTEFHTYFPFEICIFNVWFLFPKTNFYIFLKGLKNYIGDFRKII